MRVNICGVIYYMEGVILWLGVGFDDEMLGLEFRVCY